MRGGSRPAIDVPIRGKHHSEAFTEATDDLKREILERVQHDPGLDIEITERRRRPGDDVTTIHFGTFDPALLGVAEGVDEFNHNTRQRAIVRRDVDLLGARTDRERDGSDTRQRRVTRSGIFWGSSTRRTKRTSWTTASLREPTLDQSFVTEASWHVFRSAIRTGGVADQ